LIIPPFSTTPSAPTRTRSTLSIIYPTAVSKINTTGIPAFCKALAVQDLSENHYLLF